jgi:alkylresorcinol/alkylpyrone synthase
MAGLLSVATAVPRHVVTRDETRAHLVDLLDDPAAARRFQRMADRSGIARRHLARPPAELIACQTIEDRQRAYLWHAVELGEEAARNAITAAGIAASSLGAVISVSCTGYAMPSLDVHIGRRLGLNPAARRVPITELGCAAGVAALGLAHDLAAGGSTLIISTELCSLCMQTGEPATSDVLGWILFGDAAAAAVVTAEEDGAPVATIGSGSVVWPESTGDLGMRLTTTGLRLDLSADVPRLVGHHLRSTVESFLHEHGLRLSDLTFWALHPGGPRVLDAVAGSLELPDAALRPTWDVWEQYGNVSSATAFLVLRRVLEVPPNDGALGMMLAIGPGLSCEMVLLRSRAC